ncbi:CapA family protein [Komagataeibacter sp. AV436]|uniref:CapA family protein n=1 Tax=Komagataeibacter melomenusus TaxID=2766578 RepID=A0ABX2ABB2_9PROT|nr:CapA family protein [Komagataeibacter melomenusus]MBV1830128.1 CapA family protein [Komagataeibacter melomenusus]NPC65565.1 CapA family protein [Komagataeibacter melomenusus]
MKISLTGDSILFRRLNSKTNAKLRPLFDIIRGCDASFTNLELVPNDFEGDPALDHGGTHFGAQAWVLDELKDAGFDLFAAATNHSLDYSISGLRKAIAEMKARQLLYAGVGTNLEEARRPVYFTHERGTVGMLSCVSTFARGQEAAEQTSLMQGRPGVSPLHVQTSYHVTPEEMQQLHAVYDRLGLARDREQKIQLGFAFPPPENTLAMGNMQFVRSDRTRIATTANERDIADIERWVQEARLVSDIVVVSLHGHESGYNAEGVLDVEVPADFMRQFAVRAIDAGADIIVCHGPHLLRGMEIYAGRPIFYSLGNFIGQNELVERLPAESHAANRVPLNLTPHQVYKKRSNNDRKGFPADVRFWETIVPICDFADGALRGIEILPVSLGHGESAHARGCPVLATGAEAESILDKFETLCTPYRMAFTRRDGRLFWNAA